MAKQENRGRDISAPIEQITINGQPYKLLFNNYAARIAEDVYEQYYGKDVGFGDILKGIARGKYSACMALFYAAMIAGGADMPWPEFDQNFKLDSIEGIRDIIMRGVEKALPKANEGAKTDP